MRRERRARTTPLIHLEKQDERRAAAARAPRGVWTEGPRRPILVFANRFAGTLARLGGDAPLIRYARDAGLEPQIVHTRSGSQLRRLLRERVVGREEMVVVAGGDGTIHQAVQELANTEVALGILPQGTANNFATALRLPMDLPSTFRVIADGRQVYVSLGDAEGEYFTEAAGVGVFADVLALSRSGRRTKSVVRFLRALAQTWMWGLTHEVTLACDGQQFTEHATLVTVANTFRFGLGIPVAPTARLTDDVFDVIIYEALTRAETLAYYRATLSQSHTELPKVHVLQAREVHLSSPRPLRVHVDDQARKRTPITLRVVPHALKVIVDRL